MRKRIASLAVLSLAGLCLGQENYNGWQYLRFLTVNTSSSVGGANVSATQVNFPVLVRLNASNFTFAHAKGTGADIRFTKSDGVTRFKHQIEHWDSAGQDAEVWVLMDTVKGGNASQSILMYSGKASAADSSNGRAVFDTLNNFQGVFHLGEATGDTARDATAHQFKGIPRNKGGTNPTDTVGAIGHAKNFLGSGSTNNGGSYQILTSTGGNTYTNNALNFQNDSSTINGQPLYTVSAWVYVSAFPTGTGNLKALVAKSAGSAANTQYYLRLRDPAVNQINPALDTMRMDFNDGVPAVYKSGVNPISAGNWYHVAAVRSGIKGDSTHLRVWVNGYSPPAGAGLTSTSITNTIKQNLNVYIGSFSNDSGYFNGKIDEVEFSNTARDSNWLMLCYQTQKPGSAVISASSEVVQTPPPVPTSLTYAVNPLSVTAGVAMSTDTVAVSPAGAKPLTYAVSPALPAGLSLNASTGAITGTPTAGVAVAAANYTVTGTNASGSATVAVNIAVLVPPTILNQPAASLTVQVGAGMVQFGVKATGSGTLSYKWIRTRGATTDTLSAGGTAPAAIFSLSAAGDTLTISNPPLSDSGTTYKCRVSNSAGSVVSNAGFMAVTTSAGLWSPHVVHVQGLGQFSFRLPGGVSNVRMTVENMEGRVVWSRDFAGGKTGIVSWNGGGVDGRPVSSGMYVVRMKLISTDNKASEVDQTGANLH